MTARNPLPHHRMNAAGQSDLDRAGGLGRCSRPLGRINSMMNRV
jgi:hypothetical protein